MKILEGVISPKENDNDLLSNAQTKSTLNSKNNPGKLVLSTDGGVKIPYLGNNWNHVMTKRHSGKDKDGTFTDRQRCEAMIEMMKDAKGEDRAIFWHEAFVISRDGKELYQYEGSGEKGYLTDYIPEDFAETGFGVGYIWFEPQFNKTYMQLTKEEKNSYETLTSKVAKDILTKIGDFS